MRRKQTAGGESVKHRRTRSGCFTCRSRRVKCDEARPNCERCRKGGRECTYPESSSKTAGGGLKKIPLQESSSSGEEKEEDEINVKLETIVDDEELEGALGAKAPLLTTTSPPITTSPSRSGWSRGTSSETPPLIPDKGDTPETEGSSRSHSGSSASKPLGKLRSESSAKSGEPNGSRIDWSHLPKDLQYYLTYYRENLSPHYYSLRQDEAEQFFRTEFLKTAVQNEPLLHAVGGFAAFHCTIRKSGRIQDYLRYYNRSVSLLLHSLQKSQRHTEATLLTILQLATVEEYLGDWVNLLGHQKAALEILTQLYTPQSVTATSTSRMIFAWYSRFDLFAAHMAGYETGLDRDWYLAYHHHYANKSRQEPLEVRHKVQEAVAAHKLIAMDLAVLFAKRSKNEMNAQEFGLISKEISSRMAIWKNEMEPDLRDPAYAVRSFAGARPLDKDDIVNPYEPDVLYQGPLRTMNFIVLDWYALQMMHKYQTALVQQTQPSQDLVFLAIKACQIFEALELWPESDSGSVIAAQSALGIASLFLPKDDKHTMWCRRKLAKIESMGWIYPQTFREKMSALWGLPEVKHWWLPNNEGYRPIIRSIRSFINDRTMTPRDQSGEDLRSMKAIFSKMKLDDRPGQLADAGEAKVQTPYEPDIDFGAHLQQDPTELYTNTSDYWDSEQFGHERYLE